MKNQVCKAGAGKAPIELPEGLFPWENFTGIRDTLCARAILLECGERVLLLSLELTSIPGREAEMLQEMAAQKSGLEKERVWVCVTHTFSAPHLLPPHMLTTQELRDKREQLWQAIRTAAEQAVTAALANLQPATIGTGLGYCTANINRDLETEPGWWLGENPNGLSDKSVTVLRIDGEDGLPLAVLYHYSVQSSIAGDACDENGGKQVSGDLAGEASRFIERELDIPVAMFLLGAAGDQAPAKRVEKSEADALNKASGLIETLGGALGDEVVFVARKIQCKEAGQPLQAAAQSVTCPGQPQPQNIHTLQPCRTYSYGTDKPRETRVEIIRLGDIALVGIKPEINCLTATQIKALSPLRFTLPVTMVNGAAKYMADEDAYRKNTYEAMNSPFARGSAELLRDNAAGLLQSLCAE